MQLVWSLLASGQERAPVPVEEKAWPRTLNAAKCAVAEASLSDAALDRSPYHPQVRKAVTLSKAVS
jgi:hypothetical protein